jgi:hypothetical protein
MHKFYFWNNIPMLVISKLNQQQNIDKDQQLSWTLETLSWSKSILCQKVLTYPITFIQLKYQGQNY